MLVLRCFHTPAGLLPIGSACGTYMHRSGELLSETEEVRMYRYTSLQGVCSCPRFDPTKRYFTQSTCHEVISRICCTFRSTQTWLGDAVTPCQQPHSRSLSNTHRVLSRIHHTWLFGDAIQFDADCTSYCIRSRGRIK